jgi:glycosyltransferase involved in cell wall biosynthesis
MRILHVTECHAGGVSRAIKTIVMQRENDEHYLLYSGTELPSPKAFAGSVRFRSDSHLRRVVELGQTVRSLQPDVVHLHSSWAGFYGRLARPKGFIVYQPHCYKFVDPDLTAVKSFLLRAAEKVLSKNSDLTIALSPYEVNLAIGLNKRKQVVFLPNIPTVEVLQKDHETALRKEVNVVMVGRLCSQKDPLFYARVAEHARNLAPDIIWNFKWIGDGDADFRDALIGVGVQVTGWIDGNALLTALDSADYYVHSALYEGFPLSVLDAAARRIPIIARDIHALHDSGLKMAPTEYEIAEIMVNATRNPIERDRLLAASTNLLESMNSEKQNQIINVIYESSQSNFIEKEHA